MTKLKLSAVEDEKPVKVTVTLSAALHRNLVAYAEILARNSWGRRSNRRSSSRRCWNDLSPATGVLGRNVVVSKGPER